jgi:hypothetical protein
MRTRNSKIMEANKKIMIRDNFKSKGKNFLRCKVCHEKIGIESGVNVVNSSLKLFKTSTGPKIVCKNCGAING